MKHQDEKRVVVQKWSCLTSSNIRGESACKSTHICVSDVTSSVSAVCGFFIRLCPQNWVCVKRRAKSTNMKLKDLTMSFWKWKRNIWLRNARSSRRSMGKQFCLHNFLHKLDFCFRPFDQNVAKLTELIQFCCLIFLNVILHVPSIWSGFTMIYGQDRNIHQKCCWTFCSPVKLFIAMRWCPENTD